MIVSNSDMGGKAKIRKQNFERETFRLGKKSNETKEDRERKMMAMVLKFVLRSRHRPMSDKSHLLFYKTHLLALLVETDSACPI